jgi:hypothetical protein
MRYLFDHDQMVAHFVAQMIPQCRERGFGACRAIGVVDADNELIAGIVYQNFSPSSGMIELSCAALPGRVWLTPQTLGVMYRYPFLQVGCQMCLHKTLASNERLLRQLAAINCILIRMPHLFGRDQDGVIAVLTFEDWAANKICRRYRHHSGQVAGHAAR